MSVPFSKISTDGTDLQSLSLLNELQLAYSERRQAIGQSSAALLSAGADIQAASLWSTWQSWIESNVASWADHTAGTPTAGDYTGLTAIPWLTTTTLRTLAGLPSAGFRRVSGSTWPADWTSNSDPAFSFGQCQAGDIIGPWLWVDLQRAFSALRWSDGQIWLTTDEFFCKHAAPVYGWNGWLEDWPSSWQPGKWPGGVVTDCYEVGYEIYFVTWRFRQRRERGFACALSTFQGIDYYGSCVHAHWGGDMYDFDAIGQTYLKLALVASGVDSSGILYIGDPSWDDDPSLRAPPGVEKAGFRVMHQQGLYDPQAGVGAVDGYIAKHAFTNA